MTKWHVRITQSMVDTVRNDLIRSHPFAVERVGFVLARTGTTDEGTLILPFNYIPVADSAYIDDPRVGACVGSDGIRAVMQQALSHRCGVFHIHMHEHSGQPWFSPVDMDNLPSLVQSFQAVAPQVFHGGLLLSYNHINGLVWPPKIKRPSPSGRITLVGQPLRFTLPTAPKGEWYA